MEPSAGGEVVACPACNAQVAADEKFCTVCGAAINATAGPYASPQEPAPRIVNLANHGHIGKARKWLLAISILTLLSGFFFYVVQSKATEQQITEAETATAYMDPAERDRLMEQEVGMTFQEAVDHDRGMVKLLLAVNIGLAVIYLGLWMWAKKNALSASIVALLLFLTVVLISAVLEPASLAQGVIVKVFFVIALARAIQAANEERKFAVP